MSERAPRQLLPRATPNIMHITYREPQQADGLRMHQMVQSSGTLDVNSAYLYALLADHFRETVVVAEDAAGQLQGFVTAYRPPTAPHTLFVWQIAVAPAARGQGLGLGLLEALLTRPALADIQSIDCTITADNLASRRLFEKLAATRQRALQSQSYLHAEHLGGDHAPEDLYRIDWC